jgi:hypothetical protein
VHRPARCYRRLDSAVADQPFRAAEGSLYCGDGVPQDGSCGRSTYLWAAASAGSPIDHQRHARVINEAESVSKILGTAHLKAS